MTKQKYCFLGDSITEWVYVQSGKRYFDVIRNCADIWSAQLIDLYRESGLFPLNDVNAQTFFCNGKTDRLQSNAKCTTALHKPYLHVFSVCDKIQTTTF